MRIVRSELEQIAAKPSQYPPEDMVEIAFAGRSNVGKSSLLNLLTGRKKLAYVSGSPGKTRTINFYRINDEFRIVDLPGYGYARVSKKISEGWGEMMENYLENRPNLLTVIQLVDIRHEPSKQDVEMHRYLEHYDLCHIVVATKADKISTNQRAKAIKTIKNSLKLADDVRIYPVSALKKTGHQELLAGMEELIECSFSDSEY
jgi:GTP-binding protein